eukprot:GHUV01035665.1.p1 GENE.GHUV01035665.1~~GHUV01035665.1.p1  ORF type:complete len:123 (+),score=32.32 GHUV01035665.1:675-1043(+)
MTSRKLTGIGMAVAGMVAYSVLATRRSKPAASTAAATSSGPAESSFVTAEVSLQPQEAPHKAPAASGRGVLASYPIHMTDDDAATLVTVSHKVSDGGASSELRDDGDSIAASVLRRHRRAKA